MDRPSIEAENERLKASWNCFSAEHLSTYLGIEEQDQRINTHSILTRALLIDTLWPGEFDALINEEFRFGVVMTWLLQELKSGVDRFALLDELDGVASERPVPEIVRQTVAWLQSETCQVPDYVFVHDLIGHLSPDGMEAAISEIMRIVRKEAWIHCYNVANIAGHEIRPFQVYFRNRLSIPQLTASLEMAGAAVQFVSISDMLDLKFRYRPEYTATCGSFLARKHPHC